MAYRNKVYVCFDGDSDIHYYRLMLAWHQEAAQYPDFVASNHNFLVGRWRFLQLMCIDPTSGRMIWEHNSSNELIGRLFAREHSLGEYLVAESKTGFDIVTVATGERHSITPEQVGLAPSQKSLVSDDDTDESRDMVTSLLSAVSRDWMWDWILLLGPLLPLFVWICWVSIRRRVRLSTP